MRWNVEGADSATGRDRVMSVEADTRETAVSKAREAGLIVIEAFPSTIQDLPPDLAAPVPVALATADPELPAEKAEPDAPAEPDEKEPPGEVVRPQAPAEAEAEPEPGVPVYSDVLKSAKVLHAFGQLAFVMGLALLIAGPVLGLTLYVMLDDTEGTRLSRSLEAGVGTALAGLIFLIAGAFLRLNSAVALAVRDMARNSFDPDDATEMEAEATPHPGADPDQPSG